MRAPAGSAAGSAAAPAGCEHASLPLTPAALFPCLLLPLLCAAGLCAVPAGRREDPPGCGHAERAAQSAGPGPAAAQHVRGGGARGWRCISHLRRAMHTHPPFCACACGHTGGSCHHRCCRRRPDEAFGLIFEWDNCVANTRQLQRQAWRNVAAAEGLAFPALERPQLYDMRPERAVTDVKRGCWPGGLGGCGLGGAVLRWRGRCTRHPRAQPRRPCLSRAAAAPWPRCRSC